MISCEPLSRLLNIQTNKQTDYHKAYIHVCKALVLTIRISVLEQQQFSSCARLLYISNLWGLDLQMTKTQYSYRIHAEYIYSTRAMELRG